jgi:hypothetical protein
VDVKKSTIHPDDRLRDKLEAALKKYIVATAQRGRERAEERPIKLSHDTAANRVNAIMAGVTPTAPALAPAEPPAASTTNGEAEAPKKRGRPSKADVEAREAAEKVKAEKAIGPVPAAPTVEYVEVDAGENGRFFSAEKKADGGLSIQYNARHPFVRMVADAKDKRVSYPAGLRGVRPGTGRGGTPRGAEARQPGVRLPEAGGGGRGGVSKRCARFARGLVRVYGPALFVLAGPESCGRVCRPRERDVFFRSQQRIASGRRQQASR